ncbi:hypothetical protein ACFP1C_00590 [Levilactobacillus fujinensis]|uniref:Secreted protein n=1 Tax=Levilactobacillus fujinensis TaxID=2486024 RepID=A0ABW1TDR2_9LACO
MTVSIITVKLVEMVALRLWGTPPAKGRASGSPESRQVRLFFRASHDVSREPRLTSSTRLAASLAASSSDCTRQFRTLSANRVLHLA